MPVNALVSTALGCNPLGFRVLILDAPDYSALGCCALGSAGLGSAGLGNLFVALCVALVGVVPTGAASREPGISVPAP